VNSVVQGEHAAADEGGGRREECPDVPLRPVAERVVLISGLVAGSSAVSRSISVMVPAIECPSLESTALEPLRTCLRRARPTVRQARCATWPTGQLGYAV
jgi:hypothetical protein